MGAQAKKDKYEPGDEGAEQRDEGAVAQKLADQAFTQCGVRIGNDEGAIC